MFWYIWYILICRRRLTTLLRDWHDGQLVWRLQAIASDLHLPALANGFFGKQCMPVYTNICIYIYILHISVCKPISQIQHFPFPFKRSVDNADRKKHQIKDIRCPSDVPHTGSRWCTFRSVQDLDLGTAQNIEWRYRTRFPRIRRTDPISSRKLCRDRQIPYTSELCLSAVPTCLKIRRKRWLPESAT